MMLSRTGHPSSEEGWTRFADGVVEASDDKAI